MLTFLPGVCRGSIIFLGIVFNTLFCIIPLVSMAILKFSIPLKGVQRYLSVIINGIATFWISFNHFVFRLCNPMNWKVQGIENLTTNNWYLVIANHQSWADILVLQFLFNRNIPFLKFFL